MVGGIVGIAYVPGIPYIGNASLKKCYNSGVVYGHDIAVEGFYHIAYVGGIVGCNDQGANIYDCFNSGTVRYKSDFIYSAGGGIIGYGVSGPTVRNCYNINEVTGDQYLGGIAGVCLGTIENCYYVDTNESGVGDGIDSCTAKTLEEMQIQDTYTGFNFGSIWTIVGDELYDFPELQSVPMLGEYVTSLTLDSGEQEMMFGDTLSLTATLLPEAASYIMTWSTSNSEVVTVDQTGAVTAVGVGGATITVTAGIKSASCEIEVNALFEGTGSELNPFKINEAHDLVLLGSLINGGDSPYADKHYLQTQDIDLSGYENWTPIGTYNNKAFSGIYDGGDRLITGLDINISVAQNPYAGLFGYSTGTIRNVDLKDSSIIVTGTTTINAGGIVALLAGNGRVENCRTQAEISITTSGFYVYAGGIVGRSNGTCIISKCVSFSNVDVDGNDTGRVGGIVGVINGGAIVNGCANSGSVYGTANGAGVQVGGIVGLSATSSTKSNVYQCFNTGLIKGETNGYIGGIIGNNASADVENCFNIRIIQSEFNYSSDSAGGIVGKQGSGYTIKNCYNIGSVVGNKIIGGIVGTCSDSITNSYYADSTATAGVGSGSATAAAKSLEQLKLQETYVGFAFDTIWTMEGNTAYPYPELLSLPMIDILVTSIEVTSSVASVVKSQTLQMSVTIGPELAFDKTVTWSVESGTGEATIDQTGLLTGTQPGKVTVKATATDGSDVYGTKQVQILPLSVSKITVSSGENTVAKNVTMQMGAEVLPMDADNKTVTWSVESGSGDATIDSNGLLKGLEIGTVTVKAAANDGSGIVGTKKITVVKKAVTSVTLGSESETIVQNETLTLTATVSPPDATYPAVIWSSSDESVATVSQAGKVTGIGIGEATITSIADGVSDTCTVIVEKKSVSGVILNKTSETISIGNTLILIATVLPSDATHKQVTWSSSNDSIASVDQTGKVTGKADGTITITATADGQSANCSVRVRAMFNLNAATNNSGWGSVSGGGTYALNSDITLNATPNSGYRFVRWTENGAEVSRNASYTLKLTRDRSLVAEFIALAPVGIHCVKTDASLYGGTNGTVSISAWSGDSGSYEYSLNGGSSWQSSSYFGGLAAGTYTAAVRDSAYPVNKAVCSVTISQPKRTAVVSAKSIKSTADAGTAITVLPPAAPKGYTTVSVKFTTSNSSIAKADANGNVTFLTGGKVTITTTVVTQIVDSKGKVKSKTTSIKKTVTVKQPVGSISLNISNAVIARTKTLKLSANIVPTTASNKKVKWSSSNSKVATVSSAGVVTGKAGGTAVIYCRAQDGSGAVASCTVTVTPIYPTGLKMSKSSASVKPGKTVSLKATISPSKTDFKNIKWYSGNPAVATVDSKGKVKGISQGTAVIYASTSNGIIAKCNVTVK